MSRYVTSLVLFLLAFCTVARAAEVAVPKDLEPWRGWVLQGEEFRRCPFVASTTPTSSDAFRCAWPERLTLTLDSKGGKFEQRWEVFAESWVRLPGSVEHWPQQVRVNGAPGAVVAHDGFPSLRLAAGTHDVSGLLAWPVRPESVAIDARTAIVDLTLDGKHIPQPERPDGDVWLGKQRTAEQPVSLEVQVYRLLQDEVPAMLVTRIRLQVSGDGREEMLARVLPDGFTPVNLISALPARLEQDGHLRVQVRAGSWDIDIHARGTGVASRLARPPAGEGLWAKEEVWSFAGDDRLRVAAAQGADGIDPAQANVPPEWRRYPAFRMAADSTLEVIERSRGLANADDNRLTLDRQLWLDFDHRGLTAVDRLNGTLHKDWRLEMAAPYSLESARAAGEPLLVTGNPGGKGTGLELRTPQLSMEAVARTASSRGAFPATGWNARFDHVQGVLIMPPGHRLLAAPGADSAPGSWIEQWGLWDLFGVLIVAVFAGWLAGRAVGAVAFVALLLTYQDSAPYIWLWANLLAALALARAAPEGRFRRVARVYRALSFGVLGLALLPLLAHQARIALHPQIEAATTYGMFAPAAPPRAPVLNVKELDQVVATAPAEEAAPAADAVVRPDIELPDAADIPEPRRNSGIVAGKVTSSVAGLNAQQVVQRYAPGTLLQTGPGIPAWRYVVYAFSWSGPVEADQSVRFLYIGPLLLGMWRIVGIALLVALFIALVQSRDRDRWQWPDAHGIRRWFRNGGGESARAPAASALMMCALGVLCFAVAAPPARAEPDAELLNELKARLTRPPDCTPSCAEITSAQVVARGDRLDVALQVSALASVAVPVPTARDRWQIDSITVDGRSALALGREGDGALAVPLTAGAHDVRLSGSLPAAASLQLEFPSTPRAISVSTDGWDATGVNEGRLLSGSLELVRRRVATQGAAALETASEFPAFVRVRREFNLDLDWSVSTSVTRIAPAEAAMTVEVPLVPGESALSAALRTRDLPAGRRALVGIERGQREVAWQSGLARSEALDLEVPAGAARQEVWSFVVSPQWNVVFEGQPAVSSQGTLALWIYEFHPRPGEKLHLRITRPDPAAGSTLAIDSVRQTVHFGKRSATTELQFEYRSTQGGRHAIALPKNARVSAVQLDGQPAQVRPDNGVLSIELRPGRHSVGIAWETPDGATLRTQPSAIDLHSAASNVYTTVSLPEDRWPLIAHGPGVGPALLYWSELAVFIVAALLLGRWNRSPLRTHEWLLLGIGLSTLSWFVLAIVAFWLFAVDWRERWPAAVARWRFNTVQVLLALFTVIAVAALVFWGIRESLLASPDMGVRGPGSYAGSFTWFADRTVSALPRPTILSVPMWVYRGLMFAWALWLVVALLRWLRRAWRAWKTNGLWRTEESPAA